MPASDDKELYEGQALADEVIAYLRNQSFFLQGVYNMSYDRKGRAIQGDFLFLQKGKFCTGLKKVAQWSKRSKNRLKQEIIVLLYMGSNDA